MKVSKKKGFVFLAGAGPGHPGLLTLRAHQVLQTADVIVYDHLVNPSILSKYLQAEQIYVGKDVSKKDKRHYIPQSETNRLLVKLAKQNKKVVRLKGGDVFVFSRGAEEASYLVRHQIPFELIPGVSAGYAVPAYAGIQLILCREAAHN